MGALKLILGNDTGIEASDSETWELKEQREARNLRQGMLHLMYGTDWCMVSFPSCLLRHASCPLNRKQCFHLVLAGSLSHFFLDHLFEENGHTKMFTWILSTGSWESLSASNSSVIAEQAGRQSDKYEG